MSKLTSVIVAALIILLLWSPDSHAVGVGFSLDASRGTGEAEWESDFDSWDIDSKSAGFGFVLDTAPTNESVFNYRLNVTFSRQKLEAEPFVVPVPGGVPRQIEFDFESDGISVENTFGFAMVKTENFRWWAGPLVRVGYYSGDTNTVQTGPGTAMKVDVEYGEFGVGAVTGMNFKAGNVIIAPSVGFRYSGYAGEGKRRTRSSLGGTTTEKEDIEADTRSGFVNLAILF